MTAQMYSVINKWEITLRGESKRGDTHTNLNRTSVLFWERKYF